MKWPTRIVAVVWLLVGWSLLFTASYQGGRRELLLPPLFMFVIPVIVFVLWNRAGWYLLLSLNGMTLLYCIARLLEPPGPSAIVFVGSAIFFIMLAVDRPHRWQTRGDR